MLRQWHRTPEVKVILVNPGLMVTVDRLKNGGWGDRVPGRCLLVLRGQRRSDRSLDVCLLGKDSHIQSWPRLCS